MTLGAGSTLPGPQTRIQSAHPNANLNLLKLRGGPQINSIDLQGPKILGQGLYFSSTQNDIIPESASTNILSAQNATIRVQSANAGGYARPRR